jgi:serine/threonine protein kinase
VGELVDRSERLRGTRLGAYEIVRLIGHGATASVFEATHVALGRQVAIKVLHEHLASDDQVQKRFVREGRIAARLRHPNTVSVLDVGVESGLPYLVMELLGGADLRSLLADAHLLSIEHALALLLPIASALAQAHDAGVLHRDLKPANIFLSRDLRGDVVPKLVDFGLSKITTGETTTSLTAAELVAGTVLYMAPEQTLAVKNCSPASDQYSLACILYECVGGETPFTADGVYALLERIRAGVARPPSHMNPRVPEDFDDVVLRALRGDPSKRFASVRAFARALLPFADAETARTLERDFVDRVSASTPAATGAGIGETAADAVTRVGSPAEPPLSPEPAPLREPAGARRLPTAAIQAVAPLPCPPGASPFHIKGMPYRGLVFLVNRLLPGGLGALCEALPDTRLRDFVHQPFLATARYDILPFLPLYATLAHLLEAPFDGFVRASCAAQCRYDTQTVFKAIWANATVEGIAERIGRFSGQYYDFGTVTGSVPEPNVLVIVHTGVPAYVHPWFRAMHESYKEELIRQLGGEDVRTIAHEATPEGARDGFAVVTTRTEFRWRSRAPSS